MLIEVMADNRTVNLQGYIGVFAPTATGFRSQAVTVDVDGSRGGTLLAVGEQAVAKRRIPVGEDLGGEQRAMRTAGGARDGLVTSRR